ncbi:MAG: hypothetical protein ACPGQL_03700 [Thermoplasmatota archaeon]
MAKPTSVGYKGRDRRLWRDLGYYLGRPKLKDDLAFIHVPKCGGTSLVSAIRRHYPPIRTGFNANCYYLNVAASVAAARTVDPEADPRSPMGDLEILRERQRWATYHLNLGFTRMVAGHVPFSADLQEAAHPRFKWLTMARDPVARWWSLVHFARDGHAAIDDDVAALLDSEDGAAQGAELVKFIGGPRAEGDYRSQSAVAQAKANLERFDLVGILEHQDRFVAGFQERFGVRLEVGTLNRNPTAAGRQAPDEATTERIRALCAPDLAVYERACELAGVPDA